MHVNFCCSLPRVLVIFAKLDTKLETGNCLLETGDWKLPTFFDIIQ